MQCWKSYENKQKFFFSVVSNRKPVFNVTFIGTFPRTEINWNCIKMLFSNIQSTLKRCFLAITLSRNSFMTWNLLLIYCSQCFLLLLKWHLGYFWIAFLLMRSVKLLYSHRKLMITFQKFLFGNNYFLWNGYNQLQLVTNLLSYLLYAKYQSWKWLPEKYFCWY